jgi:hypothetical protein
MEKNIAFPCEFCCLQQVLHETEKEKGMICLASKLTLPDCKYIRGCSIFGEHRISNNNLAVAVVAYIGVASIFINFPEFLVLFLEFPKTS